MKKIFIKGFTLIELLVVIAIIGILTAVILPNLQEGRVKSQAAAFRSELDSAKKQIELVADSTSTYAGLYTNGTGADIDVSAIADIDLQTLMTSLQTRASDGVIYGSVSTTGDTYAIYGRIPGTVATTQTATDIWCVDSQGFSGNPSADETDQFTTPVSQCW